jgi:hypothetical protein
MRHVFDVPASDSLSFFRSLVMPSKCDPKVDFLLVRALASGASIVEAARMVGVSERTVHRKLNEPSFRQCLADVRWQIFDGSIGQLVAASREACDNLRELLKSPSDHVRLNACRLILTQVVKLKTEMENERRLSDIEAELNSPGGSARFFMESDPDDVSAEAENPDNSCQPPIDPDRQASSSTTPPTPKPAAAAAPVHQAPQSAVNTPENPDKSCQPAATPVRQADPATVRRGSPDTVRQASASTTPPNPKPTAATAPVHQASQSAVNTPENPDKSCQPPDKLPHRVERQPALTDAGRRVTQAELLKRVKQQVHEQKQQELDKSDPLPSFVGEPRFRVVGRTFRWAERHLPPRGDKNYLFFLNVMRNMKVCRDTYVSRTKPEDLVPEDYEELVMPEGAEELLPPYGTKIPYQH